jgi:hypothetical protein
MTKSAAILAGAMVVAAASPAAALGLKYGVRAGYGIGMPDPEKNIDSASVLDVGGAVMLDLAILGLEVDLLYNRQSTTTKVDLGAGSVSFDSVQSNIAIPVLARGSFPLIPMFLSLDFGGGLEPRFPIGATVDGKDKPEGGGDAYADSLESMYLYLPIFIGATLDLKLLTANLDIRYERQLTSHVAKGTSDAKDARFHELVFMAGVLF